MREALYPDTWEHEDFSYERVSRLLRFVAGETAATLPGQEGFEQFSSRVEPHSPGLRSRMWYGGASLASAKWAGENGVNFLVSSVVKAEEVASDFAVTCPALPYPGVPRRAPGRAERPACRRGSW